MRTPSLIRALATAGTLLAVAAPAARAQSGAAEKAAAQVFQDYANDGRIDPCKHSSQTLKLARDNVPPDIEQYASEYPDAISAAIDARARGDCSATKPGAAGTAPPPASAPGSTPPAATGAAPAPTAPPGSAPGSTQTVVPAPPTPPASSTVAPAPTPGADAALERAAAARPDATAPLPVIALGVLAALGLLTAALLAVTKRLGIAEERLAPTRHAWREAAWRTRGTWDDFREWVRLGR